MSGDRKAIIKIPARRLRNLLDLPVWIEILDARFDFHTQSIELKVKGENLGSRFERHEGEPIVKVKPRYPWRELYE